MVSVIVAITGGLMWMDLASSTSLSSSMVFPGAPDSIVFLESLLHASSSWLSAVEGARVLGIAGGCPLIGPLFPAVYTSSLKMSHL